MRVPSQALTISKAEGASRQVEEAIKALERGDFDIAVTLAGAAEGMLERSGRHLWAFMLRSPQGAAFDKKELIAHLNAERDWLKHGGVDDTKTLTRAHAALLLWQALKQSSEKSKAVVAARS
jgi:hypothetical protein